MIIASSRIHLRISADFERCFAFAAALGSFAPAADSDTAAKLWLAQARRRLDHGLRRRLGDLATPGFWTMLAEVQGPAALAQSDLEAGIDALASLPPAEFARRFRAATLQRPDRLDPSLRRLVERVTQDPEEIRDLAVDALRRFDRLSFAALWRQLLPRFETAVAAVRPWLDSSDLSDIATRLDLDLGLEPPAIAEIILFPSALVPEGLRMLIDGILCLPFPVARIDPVALPGPLTAASERGAVAAKADRAPADRAPAERADPALVFQALGDATRYAIAAMIAGEALTGAELARRLGVAKPTVTHHLHRLRRAGLVLEEVRGNSIALRLDRRAIENLSAAAVAGFYAAGGAVTLRRSRRATRTS